MLWDRNHVLVHGGWRTEDNGFHVGFFHHLEQGNGSAHVVLVVFQWDFRWLAHSFQCRKVNHSANVIRLENLEKALIVSNVDIEERNGLFDNVLDSRNRVVTGVDEIVNDDNFIAVLDKLHNRMWSNVASTASDQNVFLHVQVVWGN